MDIWDYIDDNREDDQVILLLPEWPPFAHK